MTPGETRNLQNRDASINRQAQTDRQANGGALTGQERQQINQRQNNVSNSINADNHNANNDAAAAARQGRNARWRAAAGGASSEHRVRLAATGGSALGTEQEGRSDGRRRGGECLCDAESMAARQG